MQALQASSPTRPFFFESAFFAAGSRALLESRGVATAATSSVGPRTFGRAQREAGARIASSGPLHRSKMLGLRATVAPRGVVGLSTAGLLSLAARTPLGAPRNLVHVC